MREPVREAAGMLKTGKKITDVLLEEHQSER